MEHQRDMCCIVTHCKGKQIVVHVLVVIIEHVYSTAKLKTKENQNKKVFQHIISSYTCTCGSVGQVIEVTSEKIPFCSFTV